MLTTVSRIESKFRRVFRRALSPLITGRSAKLLLSSGLFDAEFVSVQFGKEFESDLQAARHYVQVGVKNLAPFHPLIDPWYLEPRMRGKWKQGRLKEVLRFLDSEESRDRAWSAFLIPPGLPPTMLNRSARELLQYVQELDTLPRFKNRPVRDLDYQTALMISFENAAMLMNQAWLTVEPDSHIDWQHLVQTAKVSNSVSLIVDLSRKLEDTRAAIRNFRSIALGCTDGLVDFVFLVEKSNLGTLRILLNEARSLGRSITVLVAPKNLGHASFLNHGIANSRGQFIAFLDLEHKYDPGWLAPLLADMADDGIAASQSLFSESSLSVENAGFIFMEGQNSPVALFFGLALDDVRQSAGHPIHALSHIGMVHRAHDAIVAHGFDTDLGPFYGGLDYSMRLAHGRFLKVNSESLAMRVSKASGSLMLSAESEDSTNFFRKWHGTLPTTKSDPHESVGLRIAEEFPDAIGVSSGFERFISEINLPGWGTIPRLRWAIKNPATHGPSGDMWGDTLFADDLATALRRLGQFVVIDRREGFSRASAHLDDVELLLRGLREHPANPGSISVYWLISHPKLATVDELKAPDLVYVASRKWASRMQVATGREVHTLWQAVSADRFRPISEKTNPRGVFVGSARTNEPRQVVMDAIEVGAELQVWGMRWERYIDSRHIAGDWLDSELVNEVYGSARFVLNDHWSDMAEQGFINNRMFDAAASGARIVSDDVEGIDEIFGEQVKTYRTVKELRSILSEDGIASFPSDGELHRMAENIRAKHSFDVRAETLLTDVLEIWNDKRTKDKRESD